jgi:hypothetical protein
MMKTGSSGAEVEALQTRLARLGLDPGPVDGVFGGATGAAVRAFQRSKGLTADGAVGPETASALGLYVIPGVTVMIVSRMFPGAPVENIEANLPLLLNALVEAQLNDHSMVLMALGTIRAETAAFEPISEGPSPFNTSPGGRPFDLYDRRQDLGNEGAPDGERFKGRGFVQLTGRANYHVHGQAIGLDTQLLENPELANDPAIAAKLLASFLKSRETQIRSALEAGDLQTARRLVNGGRHGVDAFSRAYRTGDRLIAEA